MNALVVLLMLLTLFTSANPTYTLVQDVGAADSCTDVLVIGRSGSIKDLETVHLPPTGQSFKLKDRKLHLFQKVALSMIAYMCSQY
mgnify:CR=1 FL=1